MARSQRAAPALTVPGRLARMLLATDGTVTLVLEAYAGEPIDVLKLRQVFDTSDDRDADLLVAQAPVLRRRVLLRGRHSLRNLLHAEAVVAVERVAPPFLEGLLGSDKPIGLLLAQGRTETFREILRTGREPAGACGPYFELDAGDEILARTYRIVAAGRPIVVITEKFPAGLVDDRSG